MYLTGRKLYPIGYIEDDPTEREKNRLGIYIRVHRDLQYKVHLPWRTWLGVSPIYAPYWVSEHHAVLLFTSYRITIHSIPWWLVIPWKSGGNCSRHSVLHLPEDAYKYQTPQVLKGGNFSTFALTYYRTDLFIGGRIAGQPPTLPCCFASYSSALEGPNHLEGSSHLKIELSH
jgi:hypothetical protein